MKVILGKNDNEAGVHGKLKQGRGTLKQLVFGIFEKDGQLYTEIVPKQPCKL